MSQGVALEPHMARLVPRPPVTGWRDKHETEAAGRTYLLTERRNARVIVECPDSPSARVVVRLPLSTPPAVAHDVLCALHDAYSDGVHCGVDTGWEKGFDTGFSSGQRFVTNKITKGLRDQNVRA